MAHPRAGRPALPEDLIDVDAVIGAYYDLKPDPSNPDQQVVFGTSGHRGSSLDTAFNDLHIAATTQAIVEYRASQGITGPLFIGKDTHALSKPAWTTAIEVLLANGVAVCADMYTTARREGVRETIRYGAADQVAIALSGLVFFTLMGALCGTLGARRAAPARRRRS